MYGGLLEKDGGVGISSFPSLKNDFNKMNKIRGENSISSGT
jgi:hypothetical protein